MPDTSAPVPFAPIPLYVDLDGTLIKSDVSFESLLLLLKKNLFYLALVPWWLSKGLANLKAEIAARVDVPIEHLPLNGEFWQFLEAEKQQGRRLILISASNEKLVHKVGEYLALFDEVVGSDSQLNLKAGRKLARIRELNGEAGFAYAGNARADMPIWAAAEEVIMVNCPAALGSDLAPPEKVQHFDAPDSTSAQLWKAMRPHQWLKNGLVFLPLLLAHQLNDPTLLAHALLGFISFSLCASSVYLLNDLVDLDNDRRHVSKRQRPFASGSLPLVAGLAAAPALLVAAFAVALLLPPAFLLILLFYWLLTSLYSLYLKRLFLVDVTVLALLYTLRIFAGAAAVSVAASHWLVAFSLCLFLGLAMVKRVTELVNRTQANGDDSASLDGRAYRGSHLELLTTVGTIASGLAVLVFVLYANDPATRELYASPRLLWLICPLLIVLLTRTWRFARSGELHEDPLIFAITDHLSQALVAVCGVIIWLAI